jgi:putative transposase
LIKRQYRLLFSANGRRKPGFKGPSQELIDAILASKQRNPSWGCPRIARQIALAFGVPVDKDVVRRVLATYHRPQPGALGPSWLTFLGHLKDSLWSVDLFRCESALLRTCWILVVMDQYTRRIIGFGLQAGAVDGRALCRMFNHPLRGHRAIPQYLSSHHDPLYRFPQWQANLRVLNVTEIKTVPCVPWSHPFVERLLGTTTRLLILHPPQVKSAILAGVSHYVIEDTVMDFPKNWPIPDSVPRPITGRVWAEEGVKILE